MKPIPYKTAVFLLDVYKRQGQFWAKLNVGNAKLQKTSSNTSITDGNGNYSIAGATYGVFADKDCTKQLATLTTDENGNTDVVDVYKRQRLCCFY